MPILPNWWWDLILRRMFFICLPIHVMLFTFVSYLHQHLESERKKLHPHCTETPDLVLCAHGDRKLVQACDVTSGLCDVTSHAGRCLHQPDEVEVEARGAEVDAGGRGTGHIAIAGLSIQKDLRGCIYLKVIQSVRILKL